MDSSRRVYCINMAYRGAPKLYSLKTKETFTTFEAWRQNMLYHLEEESKFLPYLSSGVTWKKLTPTNKHRGFQDDPAGGKTKEVKNSTVERMLNQIANFCTPITRSILVNKTVSIDDVWQKIREHYGFQATGSNILNLSSIKMEGDDSPEDLYQRLYSFFEDCLMKPSSGITHHDEAIEEDEFMSPTLENTLVWLWLSLIHPGLPSAVHTKYGPDLRKKSLASLKCEISQAIPGLLQEISTVSDINVFRSDIDVYRSSMRSNRFPKSFSGNSSRSFSDNSSNKKQEMECTLCKAAGRTYNNHYIAACRHLPQADRRAIARARSIQDSIVDQSYDAQDGSSDNGDDAYIDNAKPAIRRVSSKPSPVLNVLYEGRPCSITLDSGATADMISEPVAKRLGMKILPATQKAYQADGFTPLDTVGEVHIVVERGTDKFLFNGLVVKNLDVDILGSMPFMCDNDVGIRPANHEIIIKGKYKLPYNDTTYSHDSHAIRRSQSYILHAPKQRTVVLPGESVCIKTPENTVPDCLWALEPRAELAEGSDWIKPQEILSVDHEILLTNATDEPVLLNKQAHLCQIRAVVDMTDGVADVAVADENLVPDMKNKSHMHNSGFHSQSIIVDPDNILHSDVRKQFHDLHRQYDSVFDPVISKYNGYSGNIEGNINMGKVLPPQRKARMPHYNRDKLVQLQNKFDELEQYGVFAKPEDVGIPVEYLNMSFLVPKPQCKNEFRLVTSFGEVGQYSRPQPSLMPNVNDTLLDIGRWKFIIKTDLKKAYFQIPLSKSSMRFCGTSTPFKGVRVYTRCAMGLPGSETALEELMNRVLGQLIQNGNVAKIADDLYVGGDTVDETLTVWSQVLDIMAKNNLGLSGPKTVVLPQSTTILGWVWSNGTLKASPHRVAALAAVDMPSKIRGLRSFIGAYKVLSRVIKGYAVYMHPLDQAAAGKKSHEAVAWTDELVLHFKKAQESLASNKVITIPKPDDLLSFVTDGALKHGIGSTLFLVRDNKLLLGGFFNAQLKRNQCLWLPCEVEALCIGASVNHFSPYLIQSKHKAQLFTDSKPCVQAHNKMCRGEFSVSARVTTFLSAVCRYQVTVKHISGINIPFTDFSSRNPVQCEDKSCQICRFIEETSECVVRNVSVNDVSKGIAVMPFTNRTAWIALQRECPDLRRVHSHLIQGTRPSKKTTKIPNVKRYLQSVTVANDGLLVVKENFPFQKHSERIVVPCSMAHGLLTALHIRLEHPTAYQLTKLSNRYFYAIAMDKVSTQVANACDVCTALQYVPSGLVEQSSESPPFHVGSTYALDIMKRYKQLILVLRETVTSFTGTMLVNSEGKEDLRSAIIIMCSNMKSCSMVIEVRIDHAPGLVPLVNDDVLQSHGIKLVLGRIKNANKNPVADKAIEELGNEILRLSPEGGPISHTTLALATSLCNSRIRREGLSSLELWTQRDQITGDQLPISDSKVIKNQSDSRKMNHITSAISKFKGKHISNDPGLTVGSLVYVRKEREKTQARCKYIIVSIDGEWCKISKFVKSQIRAKQYKVKLSEIYPISLNILSRPHVPTISRDYSDSESCEDSEEIESCEDSEEIVQSDHDKSSDVFSESGEEPAARRWPLRSTRNPNPSYQDSSDTEE